MSKERLITSTQTPVLQETAHVVIIEDGAALTQVSAAKHAPLFLARCAARSPTQSLLDGNLCDRQSMA
jgi:hypothetical protein